MFGGIVVAVAAILLGALMEASIGVIATFLLTSAVYFGLLISRPHVPRDCSALGPGGPCPRA